MNSIADVVQWLEAAPDGTMLSARSLLAIIRDATPASAAVMHLADGAPAPATWQERLWTVPSDARLAAADVAEALQRPRSWVYRHTSAKSGKATLPHRKLDGELVFVAGELRDWIREHETVVVAAPRPVRPAVERNTRRA